MYYRKIIKHKVCAQKGIEADVCRKFRAEKIDEDWQSEHGEVDENGICCVFAFRGNPKRDK